MMVYFYRTNLVNSTSCTQEFDLYSGICFVLYFDLVNVLAVAYVE